MKRAPLKLPPDTVGVADAKRDLTKLIEAVFSSGKPITIARRGKPVVRIVAIEEDRYWKWTPENAIPYDDPFWEGEKHTNTWRRMSWFRARDRRKNAR